MYLTRNILTILWKTENRNISVPDISGIHGIPDSELEDNFHSNLPLHHVRMTEGSIVHKVLCPRNVRITECSIVNRVPCPRRKNSLKSPHLEEKITEINRIYDQRENITHPFEATYYLGGVEVIQGMENAKEVPLLFAARSSHILFYCLE